MNKVMLTFFSILIPLLLVSPFFPLVYGFSETHEIGQGVYTGTTSFDLQIGDRIEGSISVSKLGPYKGVLSGSDTCHEFVEVWIIEPNGFVFGNTVVNLTFAPSSSTCNFDFTAQKQGTYQMWASVGADDMFLIDAKNPVAILNYNWTGTPMKIKILSPSNQIYLESNVSLIYTINRPSDWAGYSLDEAKNVTLRDSHHGEPETTNITLTGLDIGTHSLRLYTNDSWGNMDSKTITFTVEKPQLTIFENPIAIMVTVAIAIIILIVGLLLFRRHQKSLRTPANK